MYEIGKQAYRNLKVPVDNEQSIQTKASGLLSRTSNFSKENNKKSTPLENVGEYVSILRKERQRILDERA
tara:strand:+ start:650 stop:859 length:210 start_codon:yes stop_codon:yes gene_type:complete